MVEPKKSAHGKASRRSQFDAFYATYERFNAELLQYDEPHAVDLARTWTMAKAKYVQLLRDSKVKVPHSAIAAGMKQGLREMPSILQGFPDQIRAPLQKTLEQILREEIPDFGSEERDKLARIVKRGRLQNEDEYYLVRHRVDEIEGHVAHKEECSALHGLLDGYEGIG